LRSNAAHQRAVEDHAVKKGPPKVGVVFVHGIGSQPESDTVRTFGGALLGWLQEWHKARGLPICVESSTLSYGEPAERPARFVVGFPKWNNKQPRSWVLAEAWWAARLEPPDFVTMILWSGRVLGGVMGRLQRNIRLRYLSTEVLSPDDVQVSVGETLINGAAAIVVIVEFWIARILGYPLLLVLLILAHVPIPQVQDFVLLKGLRIFLLNGIGDAYTFLYDDIQAVHIRQSVPYAIKVLATDLGCDDIVVVAHSQGTVVALDALSSGAVEEIGKVRKLITFGAALNTAWRLAPEMTCRLTGALPKEIDWIDVWSAYDEVGAGYLSNPSDPNLKVTNVEVTNNMNIATDHGGYFTNREEFLSRVVQEIDSLDRFDVANARTPKTYKASRFRPTDAAFTGWQTRRHDRVVARVGWRTATTIGLGLVVIARWLSGDLVRDGAALWRGMSQAFLVGGIVQWLDGHLSFLGGPAQTALLAIAFWAALFALFYLALTRVLFTGWHDREGVRSAGTSPPPSNQRNQIRFRSVVAISLLLTGLLLVAWTPRLAPCDAPWGCDWALLVALLALLVTLAGILDTVAWSRDGAETSDTVPLGRLAVWLWCAAGVFVVITVLVGPLAQAMQLAAGERLIEMRLTYSMVDATELLTKLGDLGRRAYENGQRLDAVFPLVYVPALVLTTLWFVRRQALRLRVGAAIALLSIAGGMADLAEDLGIRGLVATYPAVAGYEWVPAATFAKFLFLGAATLITVVVIVGEWLLRKLPGVRAATESARAALS
jgi:hypothetical protein